MKNDDKNLERFTSSDVIEIKKKPKSDKKPK